MLQWMAASWLWALGAVGVPVAIHWLSKRQAKEVWVGSLRFFEDEESRRFQSFQLQDKIRLLLRMLFTACIVLALAQPVWYYRAGHQNQASWILVSNDLLPVSYYNYARLHHLLDSLKQGKEAEIRRLSDGFPLLNLPLKEKHDAGATDYVFFLPLLDSLAAQRPVHAIAGLESSRWADMLPAYRNKVHWHFLLPDYSDTVFYFDKARYFQKTPYPLLSFERVEAAEEQSLHLSWVVVYDDDTAGDTLQWHRFFEEAFKPYHVTVTFYPVEESGQLPVVDVWWSEQAPPAACSAGIRKQAADASLWCFAQQTGYWQLRCLPGGLPADEYELLKKELWQVAVRRRQTLPETVITPPAVLQSIQESKAQVRLPVRLAPCLLWLAIVLCIIDVGWFAYEQRGTE
ncbi:MAG: hypothetical protein KatS3mg033_1590 [Thermonema sp.]|uniref:BatA domain-containing protein n=1 Tax=Thermonema sp. TaxID=2231181 RepID=UPI0021DE0643|nr:BatA domain-containing protein [Thermonema sp.]GIV39790.1 MAG: hypothetical protein KatS3mg033_1590 [Thermonema sp.]